MAGVRGRGGGKWRQLYLNNSKKNMGKYLIEPQMRKSSEAVKEIEKKNTNGFFVEYCKL